MDETGWREANQKAWLWVAATTLATVFLIQPSRGEKVDRGGESQRLGQAILAQADL